MVKKAIVLGLLMTVTSVVSADENDVRSHSLSKKYTNSSLSYDFDAETTKQTNLVGKVTSENQIVDEDSDGEAVPSRFSKFLGTAKEGMVGFFSSLVSPFVKLFSYFC